MRQASLFTWHHFTGEMLLCAVRGIIARAGIGASCPKAACVRTLLDPLMLLPLLLGRRLAVKAWRG